MSAHYIIISLSLFVFIGVGTHGVKGTEVEYDGQVSLKFLHSLDHSPDPVFSDRGTAMIQSIRTGAVSLSQNSLTAQERKKLQDLADVDGLYRLRTILVAPDGKETPFLTFVKACSLYESHLSDILTVTLDHSGTVVAVSMSTSPALCEGRPVLSENIKQFNTTVFVRHMEQGPVPDTAAYIQKIEREKEARERGETKDNRSFLAKYWMYIVPVVIFVALSGAANPEASAR